MCGCGRLSSCSQEVWAAAAAIRLRLCRYYGMVMSEPTRLDPDAIRLLRSVREARFADGLWCIRCGATPVIRWGRARGRQRYRCRECGRTFSDLTDTPFMYSKRCSKWFRYLLCIEGSVSVRRAASLVGVHPSTAFSWRHRLLDYALDLDDTRLTGLIELTTFRVPYSEKGSRKERSGWEPRVFVIWARDRRGATFALPRYRDGVNDYAAILDGRIDGHARIVTDGRHLTGAGRFARRFESPVLGCPRFPASDSQDMGLAHIGNAVSAIRRFRGWLKPFRGVATKYLPNYLAWHRKLDPTAEARSGFHWVQASASPPTLPANREAESRPSDVRSPGRRPVRRSSRWPCAPCAR